jgi:hypothetical protein
MWPKSAIRHWARVDRTRTVTAGGPSRFWYDEPSANSNRTRASVRDPIPAATLRMADFMRRDVFLFDPGGV